MGRIVFALLVGGVAFPVAVHADAGDFCQAFFVRAGADGGGGGRGNGTRNGRRGRISGRAACILRECRERRERHRQPYKEGNGFLHKENGENTGAS